MKKLNLTLKVWRQKNKNDKGKFETHELKNLDTHMSFLEMLDVLNEKLVVTGVDPVAFDHDCREGICGMCSMVINGKPHGPQKGTTTCQLHMRHFKDGDTITIEPWRAKPFPVLKDLIVDRSSFDRIIQSGGFISTSVGSAPEANSQLVNKDDADCAFDSAICIGCGACVAVCPNASASLFVAAKINHFQRLPQGKIESTKRAKRMINQMEQEGFGSCSNHRHCETVCPKEISVSNIAGMNKIL